MIKIPVSPQVASCHSTQQLVASSLSFYLLMYRNLSKNTPTGDELNWLLEERGGHIFLRGVIDGGGDIFKSCDIKYAHLTCS